MGVKVKLRKDGTVERCKARLVAKGFQQTAGVDYFDTFSPVIKPITIRIVFAIAVSRNWKIQHIDINNAFLHGELKEVVYMKQPSGFVHPDKPQHVCRLLKAIYGLKQAPRAWNDRIKTHLARLGFLASVSDSSLFIRKSADKLILVLIYVDDILVTGDDEKMVQHIIRNIEQTFALKHLGEVSFFLGIEVQRNITGLMLSQQKYISDLLKKTRMEHCSSCPSPYNSGQKLSSEGGEPFHDPTLFRSTVGALQYLTLTRPEICFIVNKLSQFMHRPSTIHWSACKRVLRYLKGTATQGLQFSSSPRFTLDSFVDADWAGSLEDRRSTSGYCVFLGKNLIAWSSRKQHVVARSSAEAEYRALANGTADLIWIQSLLLELGLPIAQVPVIWCDNISAISLASNPVFHARTKHIEIDVHFIREKVQNKQIEVRFISGEDQLGDLFTKPLPLHRFQSLCIRFAFGHLDYPPGLV